jgi:uncharacterized protein
MANINNITNGIWSLSISSPYELIQGYNALFQSIGIILETERGSQPLAPDLGINLKNYVGQPINAAAPNLIKEIREQIAKYEPRVTVKKIEYEINEAGKLTVSVYWSYKTLTGTNELTI